MSTDEYTVVLLARSDAKFRRGEGARLEIDTPTGPTLALLRTSWVSEPAGELPRVDGDNFVNFATTVLERATQ